MKAVKAHRRRNHAGRVITVRLGPAQVRALRRDPRVCLWHAGDWAIDWSDPSGGCPDCGNLLANKLCPGCGRWFLDWTATGFDDVVSAPAITESGDITCVRCLWRHEQEDEDEDSYGWDDDGEPYWYGDSGEGSNDDRPSDEQIKEAVLGAYGDLPF